uniref:Uncharacterized protein LOC114338981 n=1 Tax=Diabrotica virgifera virgifera TaxID=50390 RepID=A0A6P7GJM4_DIAVI
MSFFQPFSNNSTPFGRKIIDGHDLEPPFNRLCSEQPNIPIADLDIIHRPIGFGRCAMTKLRRELHHKDPKVVIAALETADTLVEFGFISILLHILQNNEDNCIKLIHLKTLRALMYGIQGKMVALDNSGYNILLTFLNDENGPILAVALECLAMLTSTCLGEKFAREVNLLDTLDKLLQDERKEVHTQTAHVIMFCTVKGTGKILASKRPRLVPRLIQLCQNKENNDTQLYALQALTNICEHPAIRKQINIEYIHEVEKIQVGFDPNIKVHKDRLLEVIAWTPHTT